MPSRKANVRLIGPRTKVTSDTVIMRSSHAGGSEIIDAHRVGEIAVNLAAMLNKCGVIQPRFNAQLRSLGKWQGKKKAIPIHQFGCIVLTASAGIMEHKERRETPGRNPGIHCSGT